MPPQTKHHFHLLGICGTAMGTLAVMLKKKGHYVTGSDDNVYPPMSDYLKENNIEILRPFSGQNISHLNNNGRDTIFIIGNAISRGNAELEEILNRRLEYISMPQVLKNEFIALNHSVVVSGTHGKTTTASWISYALEKAGKKTGYMIGGIPHNFSESGRAAPAGRTDDEQVYFVIEGDEYDTAYFDKRSKFLHYRPDSLIINNIEFDHADIFNNIEEIELSFSRLVNLIPQNGYVFFNADDELTSTTARKSFCRQISFGIENDSADFYAKEIQVHRHSTDFIICHNQQSTRVSIALHGRHNVYNALAVFSFCITHGVAFADVNAALKNFGGAKRRADLLNPGSQTAVFDDFAHHPTAIELTLESFRERFNGKKIIAVFEPRSNTSVRNIHQSRLIRALAIADEIFLKDLHRKEKIPVAERLDLDAVTSHINSLDNKKCFYSKNTDELFKRICDCADENSVIICMSNGSFDGLPARLAAHFA